MERSEWIISWLDFKCEFAFVVYRRYCDQYQFSFIQRREDLHCQPKSRFSPTCSPPSQKTMHLTLGIIVSSIEGDVWYSSLTISALPGMVSGWEKKESTSALSGWRLAFPQRSCTCSISFISDFQLTVCRACTHHNEIIDIATLAITIPYNRRLSVWTESSMFKSPLTAILLSSSGATPIQRIPNGSQQTLSTSTTPALARNDARFPNELYGAVYCTGERWRLVGWC